MVSPDSDFVIVVKKSLSISYKKAIFVALGITLATLFHILYISIGFELISSNVKTIKYLGVIYLIYIGIKGILAKKTDVFSLVTDESNEISNFKAIKIGLINDALNANTILFFVGLFSVFYDKEISKTEIILYVVIVFLESILWYSFVAFCFFRHSIREKFAKFSYWIDRVTGGVLVALAIQLFFSKV